MADTETRTWRSEIATGADPEHVLATLTDVDSMRHPSASTRDRRRWPGAALGILSAISLAFAGLALLIVMVGGIGPSDRTLWVGLLILFALAAAGQPWWGDVPGRRDPHLERERRGF